ncbi:hypothetical protein DENIS_0716 [Desulfonema ishimotonii]|uniref:Uncharacterized protein n=1 Tax=Desulfonema ishimotonii TaxID=45657 RepID=A0A401FS35_9BACT|nr:hypothetical protein [Desulfonema ishimotonii]GBC59775.1 hypothetical protein DENIS_0716 [Desulfonema ishimotonii]
MTMKLWKISLTMACVILLVFAVSGRAAEPPGNSNLPADDPLFDELAGGISLEDGTGASPPPVSAASDADQLRLQMAQLQVEIEQLSQQNVLIDSDRLKQEIILRQENLRFYKILAICVLSLVSLLILLKFLSSPVVRATPTDVVNATGLILIIFGTIILVMVADVDQQLTAAVGILGAIAGYLFGSIKKEKAETMQDQQRAVDEQKVREKSPPGA